jgi:membrane peptidoglycan carboxypeptidase
MRKYLKIFILIFIIVAGPSAGAVFLYVQVRQECAERIQKGAIDSIIFSESPVYYDDGKTPIGVFFDKTHRKYVRYQDIPRIFVKALLATEDRHFFEHGGFHLPSLLRALYANLRAGKVVQGGSTITQQTAKNIFKWEKRSYLAKLKELIQARLIEHMYSKEAILEMYINQFFVTGLGKGLGIAARYYFDKDVKDLDLVESVFIAGSLNAPNRYNPFIKKTQAEKDAALRLAEHRKETVLSRMRRLSFITPAQHKEGLSRQIPFREGKVAFGLNVVLDYVREQLDSSFFKQVLNEQGIENIATSGIRIYTSINREVQEAALDSLRRHLPLLETRLTGLAFPPQEAGAAKGEEFRRSVDGLPFLARVTHVDKTKECLVVSWEDGGGVVERAGLAPMAAALEKWKGASEKGTGSLGPFMDNFHAGDVVSVRFSGNGHGTDARPLLLTRDPALEGAVIVLHDGKLKAMAGGFSNRFLNRALDARRQLGSIFKPLVYAAALQLKWNSLDPLMNVRDLFQFQNTAYIPRPDHDPVSQTVSLAWAGVKSENLASVWLLYHLTDRLNLSEFRLVADSVGLARKATESYKEYQRRIRDEHGVVVDNRALTAAAFEAAREAIVSDMIFGGFQDLLPSVKRLHFSLDPDAMEADEDENAQILRFDFKRLQDLNRRMNAKVKRVSDLQGKAMIESSPTDLDLLAQALEGFYVETGTGGHTRLIFSESPPPLLMASASPLAPGRILETFPAIEAKEVWIDGIFPGEVIDLLEQSQNRLFVEFQQSQPYDLVVLRRIRDFRVLVNLSYVVQLARRLGVATELAPVLSFPLGSNAVTIAEATLAYQTLLTGNRFPLGPGSEQDSQMIPMIMRIVDREGGTLWTYEPNPRKVLSSEVSFMVSEILRMAVEQGTGSQAKGAIKVRFETGEEHLSVPVPAYGKTGTANRYTNSSFIGHIPGPDPQSGLLTTGAGYTIGCYVGYDDNRPMKSDGFAIYGASGGLPLWIDAATAVVNQPAYRKTLQPADLVFDEWPVAVQVPQVSRIPVSPQTGLALQARQHGADTHTVVMGALLERDETGYPILKRNFEPAEGEMK